MCPAAAFLEDLEDSEASTRSYPQGQLPGSEAALAG